MRSLRYLLEKVNGLENNNNTSGQLVTADRSEKLLKLKYPEILSGVSILFCIDIEDYQWQ